MAQIFNRNYFFSLLLGVYKFYRPYTGQRKRSGIHFHLIFAGYVDHSVYKHTDNKQNCTNEYEYYKTNDGNSWNWASKCAICFPKLFTFTSFLTLLKGEI